MNVEQHGGAGAGLDLEVFLDLHEVPTADREACRGCARLILAAAGPEPVRPKHVLEALEAARELRRPVETMTLIEEMGAALVEYQRSIEPRAAAVPAEAPAEERSSVPGVIHLSGVTLAALATVVVAVIAAIAIFARTPADAHAKAAGAPRIASDANAGPEVAPGKDAGPALIEGEPDLRVVNAADPGAPIALSEYLAPGKITVAEYFSRRCRASRDLDGILRYLSSKRADLAIRQLDLDRPTANAIDLGSPLAQQHGVRTTPYLRIYDRSGVLVAEGEEAKTKVRGWYDRAQYADRVELKR
ncbi:MAG: hypothetical protein PHU25_04230 [Deltaproteobacteria bacterium]|nr:hypothetical protein [Deltaproteobacteria bacterium]